MKHYLHSFLMACIIFLLQACSGTSHRECDVPVSTIPFYQLERVEWPDLVEEKNASFILLKDTSSAGTFFGRIDKLLMRNGRIYIADTRLRSLVVYDAAGNSLGSIGKRGQGPMEYVNLSDFDVDAQGNVCVLDGRTNKALFYDASYQCVNEYRLPFEADVLAFLANDSLLWGLSSWNSGDGKGRKIAKADRVGKIGATYLDYDEYVDPSFWISDYRFARDSGQLAYNQTISNYIYLFSEDGTLQKAFYLDFGKENVPDEDKKEVESKLSEYDDYTLISKILAVTDKYIVGFLWQHRQKKLFVLDYVNRRYCLGERISDIDRQAGCGYANRCIVSYIDSANPALPDSVNRFVENEGIALQLLPLK